MAVIEITSRPAFLENVKNISKIFKQGFDKLKEKHPEILINLRQLGLMMGIEMVNEHCGPILSKTLFDNGVLSVYANNNTKVSQLLPPLVMDADLAEEIVSNDEKINEKRFAIEENCITLIATQQPMAIDLRVILSAMHLATDLERIGDYASGIAEITLLLRDDPPIKPLVDIPRMADIGIEMLGDSLNAFVKRDTKRAREIAKRDDEIDALYHKVLQQCISNMMADSKNVPIGIRLIWVGHKLERIADRVTNICERVTFTTTGKIEELDSH